jgi:hypothetical protein
MQDFSAMERAGSESSETLDLLGSSPQHPFHDLNLAGSQGVPTPRQVAQAHLPPGHPTADYGKPDMRVPELQRADLSTPGLTIHTVTNETSSLPPDDTSERPYALDIIDTPPENLFSLRDTLIPAMQPALDPLPTMERPAEMDEDTRALLAMSPLAQLVADKSYPADQMDQRRYNAALARHLTLLLSGLRDED